MRILHVTDMYRPRLGGIEVFVDDLADRQAQDGHEVTVLTATGDKERVFAPGRVRVVRTPVGLLHPLAPPLARETALAGAYDVVHAHLSVVSPFSTAVARATDEAGIATVLTVHSMLASRRPFVRAVRALADWDRSSVLWTAVSRAAADEARSVLREGTEVSVVGNAVDVDWWRAVPRRRAPDAPVTMVSVMRLAGRKRPFALLDVVERVVHEAPVPVRLVIVGDGPLEARLRAEVLGRGLGHAVTLTGRQTREQIRDLYAEADVYVAPAYQESFGIAALEARAAGLPVVAMRSGGVREFVRDGVDGLLCEDDDAMAAALTRLAADAVLRSAIAGHNAAHRPDHDWPRALAQFEDVYDSARSRRAAGRGEVAQSAASPGRSNGSSDSTDITTIGVIAQGPTT
jgi:glycosyltransferase involved in cell wall biosynthesis